MIVAPIYDGFSALQRAEIAEMEREAIKALQATFVSVLFNEPKLLKSKSAYRSGALPSGFSALQRAEIAEICWRRLTIGARIAFQCSSTSRNC